MYKEFEQIFMPVKKVPVNDLVPGYKYPTGKTHFIVVDTPNGPKIANMCSDDYGLIPNKEIFMPLAESLDKAGLKFHTQVRHIGHTKFFVDFIFDKFALDLGTGGKPDLVMPKIRTLNSYDLSIKYGINAGIWREICINGMMAPDQESFKSLKKLHTTSFSEISLSETIELITDFLNEAELIIEPFEILKDRIFSENKLEEFVEDVMDMTKFPKKQKEEVLERIQFEKLATGRLSGWEVYNGFNFQLNHNDAITMPLHKRQTLDQELIEFISYG